MPPKPKFDMQMVKKMGKKRGRARAECLNEVATLMTALKAHNFDATKCLKEAAALNQCTATMMVSGIKYHPTLYS
jgi:hypothetical protein